MGLVGHCVGREVEDAEAGEIGAGEKGLRRRGPPSELGAPTERGGDCPALAAGVDQGWEAGGER
jgi:hypothetical protein